MRNVERGPVFSIISQSAVNIFLNYIYSSHDFPTLVTYRPHTAGRFTGAMECYLSRRSNHPPHPDMRSLGKDVASR